MSQIEEAKRIKELREQKPPITFEVIGQILGKHPEACRSILRRYESNLTDEVSIMSLLDKTFDYDLLTYTKSQKLIDKFNGQEEDSGYGKYLYFSDLHGCFCNRQVIKAGILEAKRQGIRKVILNGDILHLDSASKFPVSKDEFIKTEIEATKEILLVIATEFDLVYITEGNHDARLKKLLSSKIPNGLKYIVKNVDVIQSMIDELEEENSINNIFYTWGNELQLGNVIFSHPDYFNSSPGKTVMTMADTYLLNNKNLSAVIIGHTHYDFQKLYKGVYVFETGCTCYEPDYRLGAKKRNDNWTTAFCTFTIKENGNLDYINSRIIPFNEQSEVFNI